MGQVCLKRACVCLPQIQFAVPKGLPISVGLEEQNVNRTNSIIPASVTIVLRTRSAISKQWNFRNVFSEGCW